MLMILVITVMYIPKNLFYPLNTSPTFTLSFNVFELQIGFHSIDR
jgi:hypothetical protein